jgi:Icc-related predicted phosphoesterase
MTRHVESRERLSPPPALLRSAGVTRCLAVADLHGHRDRYEKLLAAVAGEGAAAVFIGGDLLPHGLSHEGVEDLLDGFLRPRLEALKRSLGAAYPRVFVILGNDDPAREVAGVEAMAADGLLEHAHMRRAELAGFDVYGYACVPPTPFLLKDWERWDVSRYLEPGSVSPEEGYRSVPVEPSVIRHGTIARDLASLVGDASLERALVLFHAPPHETNLDRAALDGRLFEHVPLDVHVGSIAVRRFIEDRQPLVTLHGHVHESARLTGSWRERIGRTHCFTAAHDGPELALVRFDLENPAAATRELI